MKRNYRKNFEGVCGCHSDHLLLEIAGMPSNTIDPEHGFRGYKLSLARSRKFLQKLTSQIKKSLEERSNQNVHFRWL